MKNSFYILLLILLCSSTSNVFSQVSAINKLEVLYAQGFYKKVYKQANKLMDNPENDNTLLPTYYQAISVIKLSGDAKWAKKKQPLIDDALTALIKLQSLQDGRAILESRPEELLTLKQELTNQLEALKRNKKEKEADNIVAILHQYFEADTTPTDTKNNSKKPSEKEESFTFNAKNRAEIIAYAQQFIGIKYCSNGETPATGFDCSGFTSYVMEAYKIELPRRSADQYSNAKKLKENQVKKGDLVFFDSGNGVNHVGIIISDEGQSPVMIHSSTSKGIIITDINSSEYWKKRVKGYGTYLN
ncbi:MAG: NlpC/P60 family protein [Bacteroidia bacterium]|nr:MAG: NlpC/P60 family protein [Bacteroidia bacterium]